MRKDERQRLEREEMEAKGFLPKVERLLIAVDDSGNGKFAARIAGMIAGPGGLPTTVMHIDATKKTSKAAIEVAKEKAAEASETVKEFAGQAGKEERARQEKSASKLDITTKVEKAKADAIAAEAEKGYDMLIIGLDKTVVRKEQFHDDVTKLAAGFEGALAVVDARGPHRERPLPSRLSILVPVNGTELSRRGAEVAVVLARANQAPLTVLYVAPAGAKKRSRQYEEAILKDIVALAETYKVNVRSAVRADEAAEAAILKEMAARRHNLAVVGAGRRPGEKLFLGDTAAALLEKSEGSLLFVAS
jgi:nucleotide-binding universal stress UspA family protein